MGTRLISLSLSLYIYFSERTTSWAILKHSQNGERAHVRKAGEPNHAFVYGVGPTSVWKVVTSALWRELAVIWHSAVSCGSPGRSGSHDAVSSSLQPNLCALGSPGWSAGGLAMPLPPEGSAQLRDRT